MTSETPTLISAGDLLALAAAPAAVIVDVSFDLGDLEAGEHAWREGHLPGSVYLHLERDLSAPKTGRNGRHPLPDRQVFAATLGRVGIAPGKQVVALDRQGGVYAARLWWMLRWMGHADARVLDGGVAAWAAAGGELTAAAPSASLSTALPYPARPPLATPMEADAVAAAIGRMRVVDARAPERFRGDSEPLDAVAGHIPGASNRFFRANLDADGRFKPRAELRDEWLALLGGGRPEQIVHQCGSGVTACHNLLAMEYAGLSGSVLYAGSWSEWSADPQKPIARG